LFNDTDFVYLVSDLPQMPALAPANRRSTLLARRGRFLSYKLFGRYLFYFAFLVSRCKQKENKKQKTEVDKVKPKSKAESAIKYEINNIAVEQQIVDGFINGTAMCVAHGKEIKHWFENRETLELIQALTQDLGIEIKRRNSDVSSATRVSATYPDLVISKRGSPENGGGVWLHPDLAIQLAQ